MKPFPHQPDEAALSERLTSDRQKFESLPGDAPGKKAAYYDECSRLAFSLAGLAHAFDHPPAEVKSFAVHATRYAQRAVSCDEPLDPSTFERYLGLAICTGDANFRSRLAGFDRTQFTPPDVALDDVVYRAAEGMAALAKRRPEIAAEHAEAGLKRITRGLVSTGVLNSVAPLLRIAESMGRGDLSGLRAAVSERSTQYLRAASAESTRSNPEFLIDIVGLAFVRMGASDYGLTVEPKSLYMPVSIF